MVNASANAATPARAPTEARVRELLEHVFDPEIPVLNVVEMGIVRSIVCIEDSIQISVTPTYSGCPAMEVIEQDIRSTLSRGGFAQIDIKTVLSPAWTTDWLSAAAREKLRAHGIAPPSGSNCGAARDPVACPRCGSKATEELSHFGSTACQALRRCQACREPFGYFKAI
jgi:ring-1,2-phenylacetyl-CoA epoxidase subunit PaaD